MIDITQGWSNINWTQLNKKIYDNMTAVNIPKKEFIVFIINCKLIVLNSISNIEFQINNMEWNIFKWTILLEKKFQNSDKL